MFCCTPACVGWVLMATTAAGIAPSETALA